MLLGIGIAVGLIALIVGIEVVGSIFYKPNFREAGPLEDEIIDSTAFDIPDIP